MSSDAIMSSAICLSEMSFFHKTFLCALFNSRTELRCIWHLCRFDIASFILSVSKIIATYKGFKHYTRKHKTSERFKNSRKISVFIQSSPVVPRQGEPFGMTTKHPGGPFKKCSYDTVSDVVESKLHTTYPVPQGVEVHYKVFRLWVPVPGQTLHYFDDLSTTNLTEHS